MNTSNCPACHQGRFVFTNQEDITECPHCGARLEVRRELVIAKPKLPTLAACPRHKKSPYDPEAQPRFRSDWHKVCAACEAERYRFLLGDIQREMGEGSTAEIVEQIKTMKRDIGQPRPIDVETNKRLKADIEKLTADIFKTREERRLAIEAKGIIVVGPSDALSEVAKLIAENAQLTEDWKRSQATRRRVAADQDEVIKGLKAELENMNTRLINAQMRIKDRDITIERAKAHVCDFHGGLPNDDLVEGIEQLIRCSRQNRDQAYCFVSPEQLDDIEKITGRRPRTIETENGLKTTWEVLAEYHAQRAERHAID